jgi:hypothetical protein
MDAGTALWTSNAGIRAYVGLRGAKRFWHGYYSGKAVDHFTGGVIPIVESASRQESDLFEAHYDLVRDLVGEAPETAIADKGYSVESAFRKCTSNGTAPVFPWRPGGGDFTRHDKDSHDRHGVPRCKHCGAPTRFIRFSPGDTSKPADQRNPRLWVQCMAGAIPACAKTQTISCAADHRLLVPLGGPIRSTTSSKSRTPLTRPNMTGGATGTRSPPTTSASDPRSATSAGTDYAPTSHPSSTGYVSVTAKVGWASPAATTSGPSASETEATRSPPSWPPCASAWASWAPTARRPNSSA